MPVLPDSTSRPNVRSRAPLLLAAAIVFLALVAAANAVAFPLVVRWVVARDAEFARVMNEAAIPPMIRAVCGFAGAAAAVFLAAAVAVYRVRRPWSLRLARKACVVGYVLASVCFYGAVRLIGAIAGSGLPVGDSNGGDSLDPAAAARLNAWALAAVIALTAFVAALHAATWRRRVVALYEGPPRAADALAADGMPTLSADLARRDPLYSSSIAGSIVVHVLLIFLLPALLQMRGCGVREYFMPGGGGGGGGGEPAQTVTVKVVKQSQPPARRRKYVLRPNSAIIFHAPTLDESKVMSQVDQTTENTFTADVNDASDSANSSAGPGGEGQGFGGGHGKGGGWPGGKDGAAIGFVRLEYRGPDWNDGMDPAQRADVNFLDEVHKVSGLKVTGRTEAVPITALRTYRKGAAPPFVYMTGGGAIDVSDSEVRALRQYLLAGGMLFADCGSPSFHQSFRGFIAKVFPDRALIDIANDDVIFNCWFRLPGPPPLWHHGGDRSLGIKDGGRWCVFYFPGDMNDAWKTGHSGAAPAVVAQAYKMGINVLYYAYTHYWASQHP